MKSLYPAGIKTQSGARSSLPGKELLLIIVIIVNFGTCLAGLRFPTRAPGPGVTHNYHPWSSSLWLKGSRTPCYLWRGVPAALKRGATTGPTVRMRTPRSVFSAHWLNTLFHGDVLIARIHHLLLSRSFRRPPPSLLHFVNLPAASNPVCFSSCHEAKSCVSKNFTLIWLYR